MAKNKTDRKKIIIAIPNTIDPSSRAMIVELPSWKSGGVDDDMTVQVCSTISGGVSVLYKLSQCQELIIGLDNYRALVNDIESVLKLMLPEIEFLVISGVVCV
jgi:hypothetical protein